MRAYKYGPVVKAVAVVLFLIMLLTAAWSLAGTVYMAQEGYYREGYSFYMSELSSKVTRYYASKVYTAYLPLTQKTDLNTADENYLRQLKTEFSATNTNFMFTVTDADGTVLLANTDPENFTEQRTYHYDYIEVEDYSSNAQFGVHCAVREPLSVADNYTRAFNIYKTLYDIRYAAVIIATASSLLAVTIFIWLMFAAGRRKSSDGLVMTWQHKIPLDLYAVFTIPILYVSIKILSPLDFMLDNYYGYLIILPISVVFLFISAFFLSFFMTVAVRVKAGKWWRSTLIYRILSFIVRLVKKLFSMLPMIWKAALMIMAYLFVNALLTAIFITSAHSTGGVILWLLFNLAVFAALCFLLLQMKALIRAGAQISAGDYGFKVDTKNMVWDLRQHADNLNNIGAGMSKAVEERLKSERLKTELITNVSHDLKTPLTSIISYIDLLKKEPTISETAGEYIAVLDRQSVRLKKLTEDLLEASKAATGNIQMNFERTELVELINQSVGEYSERFEARNLETIFKSNREQVFISADGRLLWRVFDNLLNNICKYSLSGTRVYISIDAGDNRARIMFMNISNEPLNMDAGELLERFVRGDASRSTDGSGLGLSIAKNLTELQNGSFELTVEGDLFKTILTFRTLS